MTETMIQLEAIQYAYPDGTVIFEDFSWTVGRGETWAVLGPSGCGKSTLLYLLAGLRPPTAGRVLIAGQEVVRPRPRTGLILQEYGLLPWATVRQNAELGLKIRNFYGPDGTHAPRDTPESSNAVPWLERLGLGGLMDQYPGQLSGGQRQRTAIARTLATRPDLLLMDEPFASLDAPTREGLQNLILTLKKEQALTLVVVTHAIEEAAILGEKIVLLSQPPNRHATIIENRQSAQPGYRNSETYTGICRTLRAQLETVQNKP